MCFDLAVVVRRFLRAENYKIIPKLLWKLSLTARLNTTTDLPIVTILLLGLAGASFVFPTLRPPYIHITCIRMLTDYPSG